MSNTYTIGLDRLQQGTGFRQFISFDRPFSTYHFVEKKFDDARTILRCLSLARSKGCRTMVMEKIKPVGFLKDENEELKSMGYWTSRDIYRLSFFSKKFETPLGLARCPNDAFLGYAILKRDGESKSAAKWYVYEAVFGKYNHKHNCVSLPATYEVRVDSKIFRVKGILYCQQNGLNKSCAHVAIRSVLSRFGKDIPYREMNKTASADVASGDYRPSEGLAPSQITAILKSCDLNVWFIDYDQLEQNSAGDEDFRKILPYQTVLYRGVESGMGVLVGFELDNGGGKHRVPFYGHTFNKDTWVTNAEGAYFKIDTNETGYIPSYKWTSSFIGHDDNFGPCFCVPRLYLPGGKVDFVAEVLPLDVQYSGMVAEATAFPLLARFVKMLDEKTVWQKRLKKAFGQPFPNIVLRALCVEAKQYLAHLQSVSDWSGKKCTRNLIRVISRFQDVSRFWVVEFSLPQLFSASERKLGEIVFDATKPIDTQGFSPESSPFLFARLPSTCFISSGNREDNNPLIVLSCQSSIESHVPVLSLSDE